MGLLIKQTNEKITEIENKVPNINGLATTAELITVENKIPDVSNLVGKTDYDAEILDSKSKYFTTADYNKVTHEKLDLKKQNKRDWLVNLRLPNF